MTLDEHIGHLERYEVNMFDKVSAAILEVYESLAGNHIDLSFVVFEDLVEHTYADLFVHERDDLVIESIQRQEYEYHGMNKEEYLAAVYSGKIENEAVLPHIDAALLRSKAYEAIMQHKLFVFLEGDYEHRPLRGVW